MSTRKRVIVGLSGGVDSSVAAYLLQEQGYEVIGLFMKNWHDDSVILETECPWVEDSTDALLVAQKLGIPYQVLDFSVEYKERIVDYMFNEYEKGRTPNPDVLCNREVKFDLFLEEALKLGADYVATGHYCQKKTTTIDGNEIHHLIAGADQGKDQSYFLCQLNQAQLSKALFPIGHLQKYEVRKIAEEQGLITANKKDSQGLCFIGKVHLPDFLKQKLAPKDGDIVEIDKDAQIFIDRKILLESSNLEQKLQLDSVPYHFDKTMGKKVGEHTGAHYFTCGQRKGIGVGGTKEALFVIEKDVENNVLFVGQGSDHPGLLRNVLKISSDEEHWVRPDLSIKEEETLNVLARIRYRQKLVPSTLYRIDGELFIDFSEAQSGIAAGQFAAWYLDDELIGSGVING